MIHIAVGDVNVGENEVNKINDLRKQFSNRPLWMAASIHRGEEQGKNSGLHLFSDSWMYCIKLIPSSKKCSVVSLLPSCIKELLAIHIQQQCYSLLLESDTFNDRFMVSLYNGQS